MAQLLSFTLVTFSAIFFVVDPLAVVPLFLSITHGDPPERKRQTALKASLTMAITLIVFAAAGGYIFKLFGITLAAFKIAGGIILFSIALEMLRAQRSRVRTSPEEESEGVVKDEAAIIPLGIPMLAGPGAIATVTVLMGDAWHSFTRVSIIIACILITGFLTYATLRGAQVLERALKQTGLNILNRVMGLILAAVAVQFVVNGVTDLVPQIWSHAVDTMAAPQPPPK
jgi:multiple antibiotic resistance protein